MLRCLSKLIDAPVCCGAVLACSSAYGLQYLILQPTSRACSQVAEAEDEKASSASEALAEVATAAEQSSPNVQGLPVEATAAVVAAPEQVCFLSMASAHVVTLVGITLLRHGKMYIVLLSQPVPAPVGHFTSCLPRSASHVTCTLLVSQ